MLSTSWKSWVLLACLVPEVATAQSLTVPGGQVHSVASADRAVPVEFTLNIATAGNYTVQLTDLGAQLTPQAPLASAKLAITSSAGALVGTPLLAPGSSGFTVSAAGVYGIHVVGLPGSVPGSGPFGITVSDSNHAMVATFSGNLALPQSAAPSNTGILSGSFTVATGGSYQVTLTDMQFPAALSTLTLALVVQGGSAVAIQPSAGTQAVTLQSGITYQVFAVGQATAINAGLFGATVVPAGGGSPVFGQTAPVGAVSQVATPALAAGSYTLTLSDLKTPASLGQLGAVVTLKGQTVAQLTAAGSAPFTATADTYGVFGLGLPGAASTTGSYALAVQSSSGPPVLSVARAVAASGGAVQAYSYDVPSVSAGSYTVNLGDFGVPAPFASLNLVAVQNGAPLGTLSAAGSLAVTAAAAPLSLLVFAQPATSGGLFGIDLDKSGTTSAVYATTQGVGQLFSAQQVSLTVGNTYLVSLTDVGFPAPLANLSVIVTSGANQSALIVSAGSTASAHFTATSGNYVLNVIAQPGGSDHAGTYALSIAPAPVPVVTLTADATSVNSGGTVNLTWSSQNTTGCTASGGWSGNQATSGKATSAALTSDTTFTLTCTGAGGSAAQSVQVKVNAAPAAAGGGGGGGAFSPGLLLGLAIALLARLKVARHGAAPRTS